MVIDISKHIIDRRRDVRHIMGSCVHLDIFIQQGDDLNDPRPVQHLFSIIICFFAPEQEIHRLIDLFKIFFWYME